jgi:hypothetical protein
MLRLDVMLSVCAGPDGARQAVGPQPGPESGLLWNPGLCIRQLHLIFFIIIHPQKYIIIIHIGEFLLSKNVLKVEKVQSDQYSRVLTYLCVVSYFSMHASFTKDSKICSEVCAEESVLTLC